MRSLAIPGILAANLLLPDAFAQEVTAAVAPAPDVNGRVARAFAIMNANLPAAAAGAAREALGRDGGSRAVPATCPAADGENIRMTIRAVAQEEGIDPDLADAVAWVESRYGAARQPSRTGALGIMQLMPETAKELGVADRCDPQANIRGGIRYLKQLHARFGDPLLVLAAYNAGPANIERKGGIPEFGETERYIVRVLNRWKYARKRTPEDRQAALAENTSSQGDAISNVWKDGHVIEMD
ncbi:lytic transglycosylase domain-containing protein [Phyllobacteriaceae bacterium JZ32]